MDTEVIKKRNIEELKALIEKYSIKEDLEEIMSFYQSIYLHSDPKLKRTRLIGSKEDYIIDNSGEKQRTGKKKTVQLYVISKSMYNNLPKDSLLEIHHDLSIFVLFFNELKSIKELEFNEYLYESGKFAFGQNENTIALMKGETELSQI
jgi:hypothetical protein